MPWVDRQRRRQGSIHSLRVIGFIGTGQQIVILRIAGRAARRRSQRVSSQGEIVLFQRQLRGRNVHVNETGRLFAQRIVYQFQHLPRVGSALQKEAAHRHAVVPPVNTAWISHDEPIQLLKHAAGSRFVPVKKKRLAHQQPHSHTRVILLQCLFNCFQRLGVLPFSQLGTRLQVGPVFIPRFVFNLPCGKFRAFGVSARFKEFFGVGDFSG